MTPAPDDLDALVERTLAVLHDVAASADTITYERLAAAVGLDAADSTVPALPEVLRAVSVREDEAGRGLLTALVVRRSGLPGGGFFHLAAERGRDVSDRRAAWAAEVRRVHAAHRPGRPGPN